MLFSIIEQKSKVSSTNLRGKLQFVNSVIRLIFDLTQIPFLKCLINAYRLIVEVFNDQNLFMESNLGDWFSSYVQFYLGCHFTERAAAAWFSGKVNHLKFSFLRFKTLYSHFLDIFAL